MGRAKELMYEAMQAGHAARGQFVCGDCLNDQALAAFVLDRASSAKCDYCSEERESPFAADVGEVIEHMAECISQEYTDPANELPYESAEGGWQGEVLDAWDLLEAVGFEVESEELWDAVVSAFSDQQWCRQDYFALTATERLRYGWREFKAVVRHSRRFTFWSMGDPSGESEYHPDYMPVGGLLAEIGQCIRSADLVSTFPAGTPIWRVRVHDADKTLSGPHELAPPPVDLAYQANRMSPAGVVMFYGAQDYETACAETVDPGRASGKRVTGVEFQTTRKIRVLDLVDLPDPPSIFRNGGSDLRHTFRFLRHFAADLAIPVVRDGREHVEYVPTQAFTEYVRYELRLDKGDAIDGIRYRSAVNGKPCYVLFCTQDECVERTSPHSRTTPWLAFNAKSLRSDDASEVAMNCHSTPHALPTKGDLS